MTNAQISDYQFMACRVEDAFRRLASVRSEEGARRILWELKGNLTTMLLAVDSVLSPAATFSDEDVSRIAAAVAAQLSR